TAEGSEAAIPSRRSGTHWPLASGSVPAEQEQLAPRSTEPIRPSPDPNAPGHRDGTPAAASAQTPSAAVHPGPGAASPPPVTDTHASDGAPPEPRSRHSQWVLLGVVLVVVVALVVAVATIAAGLRERVEDPLHTEPVASAPATEEETTEEEPTEEEPTEEEEL